MKNGTVESFYLPLESERPQDGAPRPGANSGTSRASRQEGPWERKLKLTTCQTQCIILPRLAPESSVACLLEDLLPFHMEQAKILYKPHSTSNLHLT